MKFEAMMFWIVVIGGAVTVFHGTVAGYNKQEWQRWVASCVVYSPMLAERGCENVMHNAQVGP